MERGEREGGEEERRREEEEEERWGKNSEAKKKKRRSCDRELPQVSDRRWPPLARAGTLVRFAFRGGLLRASGACVGKHDACVGVSERKFACSLPHSHVQTDVTTHAARRVPTACV